MEVVMRVIAGTTNPSKLVGIRRAFEAVYGAIELSSIRVETPNPQPLGLLEILHGAKLRAETASKSVNVFDFSVGVEAGIIQVGDFYIDVQLAYVMDNKGGVSIGLSPGFPLPRAFTDGIFRGDYRELEEVADAYYGTKDIGEKGGLIKLLSKSMVTREDLTFHATLMALITFMNRELYEGNVR